MHWPWTRDTEEDKATVRAAIATDQLLHVMDELQSKMAELRDLIERERGL